jgi:hypothetical protein
MNRLCAAVCLLLLPVGACAAPRQAVDQPSALERDVAAYAMASCFAALPQPIFQQQGERWAGAVIQRGHGAIEQWTALAEAVAGELKRTGIAQGQGEGPQAATVPLPVMTCGEITTTPAVRAAMRSAEKGLAIDYGGVPH